MEIEIIREKFKENKIEDVLPRIKYYYDVEWSKDGSYKNIDIYRRYHNNKKVVTDIHYFGNIFTPCEKYFILDSINEYTDNLLSSYDMRWKTCVLFNEKIGYYCFYKLHLKKCTDKIYGPDPYIYINVVLSNTYERGDFYNNYIFSIINKTSLSYKDVKYSDYYKDQYRNLMDKEYYIISRDVTN